jgi:hypothetical protein
MSSARDITNMIAASCLAVGSVFGMAGTFLANPNLQALSWGIDSSALVAAGALLAMKHAKLGGNLLAAGFLVLAIASGVMLSGTAAGPAASVPAFAAGAALWSVALLLTSIPRYFARPHPGTDPRSPLHHHLGQDLRGQTIGADRSASAVLRLSLPRHDLHWLDL